MPYVFGLLIATLLGADAKPTPAPETPEITYKFKVLDMEGLDWRSSLSSKLQPINRLGGATVWSAPGDVVPTLVRKADKVLAAPKVTSFSEAPAHFNCTKTATNPSGDSHNLVSFAPADEKGSETRVGVCMTVRGTEDRSGRTDVHGDLRQAGDRRPPGQAPRVWFERGRDDGSRDEPVRDRR